jgi:hypothetical protein
MLECPLSFDNFLAVNSPISVGASSALLNANITNTTAVMWANQNYFILTTQNTNITTAMLVSGGSLPSNQAITISRIDALSGALSTTPGTWNGTSTPTNQISVVNGSSVGIGQTVSGLGIPNNARVSAVAGNIITLDVFLTTSGTSVSVYFGHQRIVTSVNATSNITGGTVGFLLSVYVGHYFYGRGIPSGTTVSSIVSETLGRFTFNLSQTFTANCLGALYFGVGRTATNTNNNCIFMDFSADPSDGYLKVRLGYMLNGLISYSPWASFPAGNIPINSYTHYMQAVIDFNASTGQLRLFANRFDGTSHTWPSPPSTPIITMTGAAALLNKLCGIGFAVHNYGNNINNKPNATLGSFAVYDATYFPNQTFID